MSKHDIEIKHLIQKNNLTFVGLLAIHILAIVCNIMYSNKSGSFMGTIITSGIIVFGLIVTIIGKLAFGKSHKGHLVMFVGVLITYFDVLWTNVNTPILYAFTFLICFVIMLHKSVKTCVIGIAVAIVGNGVFTVLTFILGDGSTTFQVITNDWFAIIGCLIAFFAVKMLAKQDKELLDNAEKQALEQQEVAEKIKTTTSEIKDLLGNANESVESLANNIESSSSSVNQISASTRQTAASIETQTAMSSNITNALEEVVKKTRDMAKTSENASKIVAEGNKTVENLMNQSRIVSDINGETAQMTSELQSSRQGFCGSGRRDKKSVGYNQRFRREDC